MTSTATMGQLDRFAPVGDLAWRVRRLLERTWVGIVVGLAVAVAVMFGTRNPGAVGFTLMAVGTTLALGIWRKSGIGLPILPMLVIQNLFIYGLPILTNHEVLRMYPSDLLTDSGVEVLLFDLALAIAWALGMQVMHPAPPLSYALPDFQRSGSTKLKRIGLNLIIAGTVYLVLQKMDLLGPLFQLLPAGSTSLLLPLVVAATACGLFLVGLFVGSHEITPQEQILFWGLLATSCVINASTFLLSGVTTLLIAVFTGLFWSSGRIPWKFVVIVALLLSFLNLGKFTMRGRYWQFGEDQAAQSIGGIAQIPALYGEWATASLDILLDKEPDYPAAFQSRAGTERSKQSLLERINNLQNLLFVIDAMEFDRIPPLNGQTYSLIPPLLVPRILWPDKPRTHAGQVMLNVHFGRQDLNSTFKAYVAWGLLPEAYGNFGPLAGALILGGVLGLALAWIENYTAQKLLLSLEGFASFMVLLGLVNSFEMVASVLVTSIFQSVVPIIAVSFPFLRRTSATSAPPPPPA